MGILSHDRFHQSFYTTGLQPYQDSNRRLDNVGHEFVIITTRLWQPQNHPGLSSPSRSLTGHKQFIGGTDMHTVSRHLCSVLFTASILYEGIFNSSK
ncbi:hypothetical protein TNCV_153501 [Trichonephila clavipes]|nr:hypothetical protein TNCV_153501 [Trichonephila clavipes]